jgi:predicted metal-binding protein
MRGLAMAKIAIINCSNLAQELSCPAFFCLANVNAREGMFARYKGDENFGLVGLISCAGCPTALSVDKLDGRVKSLVAAGANVIHLSSCLIAVCPFKNKYVKFINDNYPQIDVVLGTHHGEDGCAEEIAMFKGLIQSLISQEKPNFPEAIMSDPDGDTTPV